MPDILTERPHNGAALISELPLTGSRDSVTIAKGQVLPPCRILGKVTIGGVAAATPTVTGTGNGTSSAVTVAAGTKLGTWRATLITAQANAGIFQVKDPDGIVIGTATVGVAFSGGGLGFTISDGATDFIVGDYFDIVVRGASATAFAGNTGDGAMGNITTSAGAVPGTYKLIFIEPGTNAGKFIVQGPTGMFIGRGTVGQAFNAGGLSFTLADGGTDFISGDGFDITVAAGSGQYRDLNPAAIDGSGKAAAVLIAAIDTTDAEKTTGAWTRICQLNDSDMSYGSLNTNQKATAKAELASLGILIRDAV